MSPDPEQVYRRIAARMPHHAGSPAGRAQPATVLTDPDRLRAGLAETEALYGPARPEVLGTIWWYSASSVLLAPALESLVLAGVALDPALESVTLLVLPDGRFAGARSAAVLDVEPGPALGESVERVIAVVAEVSGAGLPALRAVATDSIANRLLWAGMAAGNPGAIPELAERLVHGAGNAMPAPRYVRGGANLAVRRASCCLIYQPTGGDKCVSCPRQQPAERARRLRAALG